MDNYRLTPTQWRAIHDFQGGLCYGCRQAEPVKGRRLSVDHDHATGLIRGLLCSRCNPIVGKLENAYKRYGLGKQTSLTVGLFATRIAEYLNKPPAVKALGIEHLGYSGRTNTKAHRLRLKKERKNMTPSEQLSR
jgi:hypothetical protein